MEERLKRPVTSLTGDVGIDAPEEITEPDEVETAFIESEEVENIVHWLGPRYYSLDAARIADCTGGDRFCTSMPVPRILEKQADAAQKLLAKLVRKTERRVHRYARRLQRKLGLKHPLTIGLAWHRDGLHLMFTHAHSRTPVMQNGQRRI
jgi:hypothetical protein